MFFVIYDFWFHEFVLLKLTLDNQTTPDSILILEFIVINYQGFFQVVWFTNIYQMKIEFSIKLVQSHLKPTPMILAEVSKSFSPQKGFMGEKVVSCMQSITCGHCRCLFFSNMNLSKNKNIEDRKIKHI